MSDAEDVKPSLAAASKPTLTERDQQLLNNAWQCLKSGFPEIDYEKFQAIGGFQTQKGASNAWGLLKKKIFADSTGKLAMPSKTKSAASTPKKRAAGDEGDADAGSESTPAKKRKSPAKKTAVKKEIDPLDAPSD